MQSQNRFFDDLSKVLNGLAGTVAGVGREAEAGARERAKEWFGGMDFVSREEFDAVKEMAAKARAEADALNKRVEALEKYVSARKPATRQPKAQKTKAPASKSSPKKDRRA
ncbi:FIG018229: hypothetical protein [hydrothermal vent metagenome]|uniref:Accessory factor UbiK family protein n=1 Tax=hydrothermal vent metagenome TaxID=652676 RepID=A0A3B0SZ93_9ZZZZ